MRQRVIVPTGASSASPTVTFVPDLAGPHVPSPAPPESGSGRCQIFGGSRVADVTSSGTRVYAYSWQPVAGEIKLCLRIDGTVDAGAVLTIDATTSGGVPPPSVTTGSDLTGCTLSVAGIDTPVRAEIRRSATSLPASVCVTVGTTTVRVTADTGSDQPTVRSPGRRMPARHKPSCRIACSNTALSSWARS